MRFTYENQMFLIEFERQHKERPAHVQPKRLGETHSKKSVQTTAKIYKITGPGKTDREVFREYTVGHYYKDKFTFEGGRKAALTMALYDAPTKYGGAALMGQTLTKDFRTAVWVAYHNR